VKGEGLPRVQCEGRGVSQGNNTWVRCLPKGITLG
jgi:hypothetical protein